jgi:uncharacterized protein YkwD
MKTRLIALLAAIALVLSACQLRSDVEDAFLADLNARRTQHGLPALVLDHQLRDDARGHSLDMLAAGRIYHARNLRHGENVGRGHTWESLAGAFWDSHAHRRNILGDYDKVGIGVYETDNGWFYVTFRFGW